MQEETEWNRLVDACRPNRSKESILLHVPFGSACIDVLSTTQLKADYIEPAVLPLKMYRSKSFYMNIVRVP